MAVVSVSLPDAMVAQVDHVISEGGFTGRSEVVRAALRDFFHAHDAEGARRANARRTATLTVVYEEGAEREVSEIRHRFGRVVSSMMHSHAGPQCVELYFLAGSGTDVRTFADRLRAARPVLQVHLAFTDATTAALPAAHEHD